MARAPRSTKSVDGKKVCDTCKTPKSALDYPSTSATTCAECATRAPEHVQTTEFVAPSVEIDPSNPSTQELAARVLARRRLIPFVKRFRPNYMAGWVHEDICRRLERFMKAVERKESPRMVLMMPVRMGKSELGSRHFAPWLFGHHPEWEIIAASGGQSLALTFSRYIRDLMRDPSYQALFPATKLDPSSQSVENWNTTSGGGYMAAGIGTMIVGRGAHCFPAGTLVRTDTGRVRIEHLSPLQKVLAYDHETESLCLRPIKAVKRSVRSDMYEVTTANGRKIVATGDHPFYVRGVGYTEARLLSVGSPLTVATLPSVRESEKPCSQDVQEVLLRSQAGGCSDTVLPLLKNLRAVGMRAREGASSWARRLVLLQGVQRGAPRGEEREALRQVRGACDIEGGYSECEVLLTDVCQPVSPSEAGKGLPTLFSWLHSLARCSTRILFTRLCEPAPLVTDDRSGELSLQGRPELQPMVRHGSKTGIGEGWGKLCSLSKGSAPHGRTPHQPHGDGQQGGELGDSLPRVSRGAPQVEEDSVAMVKQLRCGDIEVYDLQVEGTSNFFAEEILVHNCLLIDDPCTSAEAADSQVQRDSTFEWYIANALNRLAPGGGVLGIMTHWNEDDWAGRVQMMSKMDGDSDKFEVVKYPAINDIGDEYILADDSIEQLPPGSDIPEGARMTRPMNTPLHPERYTYKMLMNTKATYAALGQQRWWAALYQQSPSLDDGVYFTKKMFKFYTSDPHPLERSTYQTWDFAITEKQKSDYTVGATGHVDKNNNLHVADLVRFKSDDAFIIADAILDNWVAHGSCAMLGFEDGSIWKAVSAVFLRRCDERNLHPSYELLVPLTDKGVRAMPLKGLMQGGKVWFKHGASWWEVVQKELTQFLSGGKHDDTVDALAWLARLALKHTAPKVSEPKPMRSWKDDLMSRLRGGGGHMSA